MAQTVAFALLGAFILSLTYVPMMSALFLSKKIAHKQTFSDRMMNRIERIYQRTLQSALKFPKTIIASAVLLFAIAVFIITQLGGEFIPVLPEGDFAVETRVLPGSNLNTSTEAVSKGARILLKKFPEVEKIVGKTGSSEIPTDPMPIDASDMMVILKHKSEWTSAKTYDELMSKMSKELEAVPGVTFGFQYPVAMRFNELMTGARQDVVCKIFGENLDTLAQYAKKLGNISNTVEGARDMYVEAVTGMPQIVIQYNRAAIAQYGLNVSDINKVVNMAFAGQSSGLVYEGEKRFDLVVRLSGEQRKDLQDVQNLLIPTPQGTQITLSAVAKVEIIEGPNQIQRENSFRRIVVGFNVRGRDVQSMVKELQQKVDRQLHLPPGYYITYGGTFENLEAAQKRLRIAVPVSLLLIFLMLYFAFGSVKQGLLIYSAIPLSAIGGILALALRGIPFSISAGVGFIALFGVAVLNGIVLVAEFNRLKKEGIDNLKRIVIEGTKTRLRPVLMTATVASLGFLPMALSTGEGAEVQRPLATVVIGGLLVATFLTLFVLPILYIMFEKGFSFKKKVAPAAIIILFMISLSSQSINAQPAITLQAATDTALKNNLTVKNEKLRAAYQKQLIKTAKNIPPTNVIGEFGQINSFYLDTRFGIAQTISFPKVYAAQKTLLTEEWKSSLLNVGVKETVIKKQVAQVYHNLLYLQEKKKLLQKIDSLFAEFLNKATLRFNKGESNISEKTTAENQRGQISLQLLQVVQDMELQQIQFQLLLNTNTAFVPDEREFKINTLLNLDTAALKAYPLLQYLKQQQQIAAATTQAERAKLFPSLTLGYNIMAMKGAGADNKIYNSVPQFQSVQIGLGIPIFTSSQRAKINAAILNETVVANEYEVNMKNLEAAYKIAIAQYEKQTEAIQYFEITALKNADIIISTANKQFIGGDINYLEWVMLINQSVTIQSEYIEAVKNRNNFAIEINLLSSNK